MAAIGLGLNELTYKKYVNHDHGGLWVISNNLITGTSVSLFTTYKRLCPLLNWLQFRVVKHPVILSTPNQTTPVKLRSIGIQGPLLLTWSNFNPSMDK